MRQYVVPFAFGIALAITGCATQPDAPPTVANAGLSTHEVLPGDTFEVSFDLDVADPAEVERVYVRGLPKNSLIAGTATDLDRPHAQSTTYQTPILLEKPAADGQYNLELVVEMTGRSYVAPLGSLAVLDAPSRIVYAQFAEGSHAAGDCYSDTRLLALEYTVEDDNGAADFVAPAIAPADERAEKLVFFPHWQPVTWLNGDAGIRLNQPRQDTVEREMVSSDIRIYCSVEGDNLFEFTLIGQDVSKLTGQSTPIEGQLVRYYVE